jgi:Flp pilus assembly protein TadG
MSRLVWWKDRRHQDNERGQSLVEMTVGAVILILILSGLLDLGRVYYVIVALEDGAGEAALYLAINPECWTAADGPQCADPNNAEYRARHSGGELVDWSTTTITVTPPSAADRDAVGDTVTVSIVYPYLLLTPVIPQITGVNPINLTGMATQIVITDD